MIKEEIIVKFFEGKCDARDAAGVHAWFKENPAKLKEYLGVEEWEEFQPAPILSPDISGKLWNEINKDTASPEMHYSHFRWMAAAASVLLVIGLSWNSIFKKQTKTSIISRVANTTNTFNNTPRKMTLTLSDGSTVELLPNSTLSCPEDFNSLKRDVKLSGEATFNIAKDVARPFSVYSGSILITVLGTRFTVRSYEANNAIKVILHEGRVMVKISNSASKDYKNEFYLAPGDIFIFRKIKKQAQPTVAEHMATPLNISNDSLSTRVLHLEKDNEDRYVFDNYPLDVVFDQLQNIYDTKIIYDKAELGNRSFIGKIDKTDSLCNILKSIALLNHFGLQKQGESFVISAY